MAAQLLADDSRIVVNHADAIIITVANPSAAAVVADRIASLSDVERKQVFCRHEWKWVGPGDCLVGCCHGGQ